jgi:hypothetical protein
MVAAVPYRTGPDLRLVRPVSGRPRLSNVYFADDTTAADAVCARCGEPLEDFTSCACHLSPGAAARPVQKHSGSMRELVHRKLARQAAPKK